LVRSLAFLKGPVVAAFTLMMLFTVTAWVSYQFWSAYDPQEIHIVHSSWADPYTIPQGKPLRVVAVVTRHKSCRATVNRYVLNEAGEVVWTDLAPGNIAPLGERLKVIIPVYIPWLPPGRYYYRSVVFNDCGNRLYEVRPPKDVEFVITPASQDHGS